MNLKTDGAATGRTRQAPLRITKRGRAVVTVLAAIPLVAGALVFEVTVFLVASFVVGRDRPPVTQLDSVPPITRIEGAQTS